jgi:hypothetical protein
MSPTECEYLLTLIGGHITMGRVGCEEKGEGGGLRGCAAHVAVIHRAMIGEKPPSKLSVSVSRIFPLM